MSTLPTPTDVTMLLYRDGKFLMQRRSDVNPETGRPPRYPGAWCFPGEHIEDTRESAYGAVVRGAREEYGLFISHTGTCWHLTTYQHDGDVDAVYFVEVPPDQEPVLKEGKAMAWKTFDEVRRLSLAFEEERILPAIRDFLAMRYRP